MSTHWNLFNELEGLMNRHSLMPRKKASEEGEELVRSEWNPSVDICENKKKITVKAELPGVEKDDLKVSYDHGTLTISGEKHSEKKDLKDKQHRYECHYGLFTRSFTLPCEIEEDKIVADYKNGILKLTVPKRDDAKTSKINIAVK